MTMFKSESRPQFTLAVAAKTQLVCIAIATMLLGASAAPRQAIRADHFAEHVGVVTHFNQAIGVGKPYETRYSQLLQYCRDMGFRYYRQGSGAGNAFAQALRPHIANSTTSPGTAITRKT